MVVNSSNQTLLFWTSDIAPDFQVTANSKDFAYVDNINAGE
jgi:hypothetical protein